MVEENVHELVFETNKSLKDSIRNADKKASILLTAQLAFLGLFGNAVGRVWTPLSECGRLFAIFTATFGLLSIFGAGYVVYPRESDSNSADLLYWKTITENDVEDYVSEILCLNDQEAIEELVEANYNLATVAREKYTQLRLTIMLTVGMVVLATITAGSYLLNL